MDHDRFDKIAKWTLVALSFGQPLALLVMQPPIGSPLNNFLVGFSAALILGTPLLFVVVLFIAILFS